MKRKNTSRSLKNSRGLAQWLGFERRPSSSARALRRAGLIGSGLAIGGGVALLTAPQKGSETRRRIQDRIRRFNGHFSSEEDAPRQIESKSTNRENDGASTRRWESDSKGYSPDYTRDYGSSGLAQPQRSESVTDAEATP